MISFKRDYQDIFELCFFVNRTLLQPIFNSFSNFENFESSPLSKTVFRWGGGVQSPRCLYSFL